MANRMVTLRVTSQERERLTFNAHCSYNMVTAIKHPVPDRVKPSFVVFDIRAL